MEQAAGGWIGPYVHGKSASLPPCLPVQRIDYKLRMGRTMEKLPRSVQEIADVIGRERALFLIGMLPRFLRTDSRGGEQVILYVPRSLKPDHHLVRIMGWHDAERLVRAFGGELLKPANCGALYRGFRDQGILGMVVAGMPMALVAEWFGVSERHVKNLLAENPQEVCRTAANDNARNSTRATQAA